MQSMTGFGRAEAEQDNRKVTVELKSVNHRFLDINIRIPRTLGFAEELVRKAIKQRLARGRVDVFINYFSLAGDAKTAVADTGLMRSYLEAARKAAGEIGMVDDLALSHMIRMPDVILIDEAPEDEDRLSKLVGSAVETALEALNDMRAREGDALKTNISECLEALTAVQSRIETRKAETAGEYALKLRQRITELMAGTDMDEARFASEVALMADRADITEEIVRLKTHIDHFNSALGGGEAVGRKLDFLVQELNRELNTIGSKSQDTDITGAVIEGKSLVEKIREQVQNIE